MYVCCLQEKIDRNELQIVNREEIEQLTKTCINDGTWADIVKKEVGSRMESVENELSGVQRTIEERKIELDNQKEREERKYGVVLYNASEVVNASNFNEQFEADMKLVCDIMSYIIDERVERNEFKKLLRLGKRDYNQTGDYTHCRPLLVVFANGATKNYVMNSLFRLKNAEDRFKRVIIGHDMTARDRAEFKEKVAEAKEKQENDQSGEYLYRVRGLPGEPRIQRIKKRTNRVN